MIENVFLEDTVILKETDISILYEKIISWLKKEKKTRIIEEEKPVFIKFFFEKDLGFYGFGRPFLINLASEENSVTMNVKIPFPKSHGGLSVTPLVAYLALEDIYINSGVFLDESILKRIFPKHILSKLIKNVLLGCFLGASVITILLAITFFLFYKPVVYMEYMPLVLTFFVFCFVIFFMYLNEEYKKYRKYNLIKRKLY